MILMSVICRGYGETVRCGGNRREALLSLRHNCSLEFVVCPSTGTFDVFPGHSSDGMVRGREQALLSGDVCGVGREEWDALSTEQRILLAGNCLSEEVGTGKTKLQTCILT